MRASASPCHRQHCQGVQRLQLQVAARQGSPQAAMPFGRHPPLSPSPLALVEALLFGSLHQTFVRGGGGLGQSSLGPGGDERALEASLRLYSGPGGSGGCSGRDFLSRPPCSRVLGDSPGMISSSSTTVAALVLGCCGFGACSFRHFDSWSDPELQSGDA